MTYAVKELPAPIPDNPFVELQPVYNRRVLQYSSVMVYPGANGKVIPMTVTEGEPLFPQLVQLIDRCHALEARNRELEDALMADGDQQGEGRKKARKG